MDDPTDNRRAMEAAERLTASLERLARLDPTRHHQILQLINAVIARPAMTDGEVCQELSRIAGSPVPVPNPQKAD